ncbi:MAG: undecaprenyl/decaprenyl-phosphate alpha-N-acetylglucosaminyl 1-phosphate transferase [Patescibacteria group bacterium]|nr:MAG: undecaprenyl/decaprenyl-phosphate alpha-N-acetylglucosaminyl 1-phosphate transferase [Patescibacteria group bacterium]
MVYILALILSFVISYSAVPFVIKFAERYQLLTDKRVRYHPAHTHKGVLPRAGGVGIFLSVFISSLLFITINKILLAILLSSLILLLTGLWDDRSDVSPYIRFGLNIFASVIAVMGGLGIPFISNPFGEPIVLTNYAFKFVLFKEHNFLWLSNLLSIIWIVFLINAVNWSKGVDGQMPGFVAIASIFLGLLASRFSVYDISVTDSMLLAFIVAGAFLGFLPFNFYPQKILPGYSAGSLAGFYLAILSLLSVAKLGTLVLVLAVPFIDAVYTITRRLAQGRSPFMADWGHFHHRLLEIGWGRRRIAVFYWLVTFILGIPSLFLDNSLSKFAMFLSLFVVMLFFILILNRVKKIVHLKT